MSECCTEVVASSREEWLELRMDGLGGSDSWTAMGLNPWKSRMALWAECCRLIEPDDLSQNEAVRLGTLLEPVVAGEYARATGRKIFDPGRFRILRSAQRPWMFATLDREIPAFDSRGPGVLEIKTTGAAHADEWEEEPPIGPMTQIQHQMVVTGCRWGSLAVLIGGQRFRWIDVEYHPEFAELLVEEERAFWDLVRRRVPPDPDEKPSTRQAIERMFPRDKGETIELPPEAEEWACRRRELKDRMKRMEEELAGVENRIKLALGDAAAGVLPDGTRFSWKLQRRPEHVVPAAEFRVLREIKGRTR